MPFGAGRRICVGVSLALKQIQLILASLIYAFVWFLPSGMDPKTLDISEEFSIPIGMAKPLHLILEKKNNISIE